MNAKMIKKWFLICLFPGLLLNAPLIGATSTDLPLENPESILFWDFQRKIKGFKLIHRFVPGKWISKSSNPIPLPAEFTDLSNLSFSVDNNQHTLKNFLQTGQISGFIVVRDGKIHYEKYRLGHSKRSKWTSFSIAKSVTSLLIGAAIQDGYIRSVQDKVTRYLPQLENSSYDEVTIEDILQMSSGVDWNEDYEDPKSDVSLAGASNALTLHRFLKQKETKAPPGTQFKYSTGESNLAGGVLRAAIGNDLATYLELKIWQPFGMESDAFWMVDQNHKAELGGCCLNATLRDYARIGMFALANGKTKSGDQVLPSDWIKRSTTALPYFPNYGYLWWLNNSPADAKSGAFAAFGIFGQVIWVNPKTNTVIAIHAATDKADNRQWTAQAIALINAIDEAL